MEYRKIEISSNPELAAITLASKALYSQLVDGTYHQITDITQLVDYINHGVIIYWGVDPSIEWSHLD